MRNILRLALFLITGFVVQAAPTSPYTVDLARAFGKDVFDLNAPPYLTPLVQTLNAASNSRFFNAAYIPKKVDKPYFRFGIQAMAGFVRDDQTTYAPKFPTEQFDFAKISKYGTYDLFTGKMTIADTGGLINYLFKTVLYNGVTSNKLAAPSEASTILGSKNAVLKIDNKVLQQLVKEHQIYALLPKNLQDTLLQVITGVPESFTLPPGGNLSTIMAMVPQIEIGSLYGTEAVIRFIPSVNLGKYVGDFSFFAFGLKHSISQYFYPSYYSESNTEKESSVLKAGYNGFERNDAAPFDMAVQVMYQGTHLKNTVGATNAQLTADAKMFSANLHASKSFKGICDIYTGFSYEKINIDAKYVYTISLETQIQLGLRKTGPKDPNDPNSEIIVYPETPEYPGDHSPQTTNLSLKDNNFKWTIGAVKSFGPISLCLDYSVSQFNILSFGVDYRF